MLHYNVGVGLLDYLGDPKVFAFNDGFVSPPRGPELGVELDEEKLRKAQTAEHWQRPTWRNEDGSLAQW
jgi:galactonate dehydratase